MPYILLISSVFADVLIDFYGTKTYHKTYIKSINTPNYSNTKKILEKFNALGDNKIVSFVEKVNGRPIVIEEMSEIDKKLSPGAVGIAFNTIIKCRIVVLPGLSEIEYEEVLLHEYLHCYGYDHVDNYRDLMYYSLVPVDKEQNIKDYAQKVKKKFYE